MDGAFLKGYIYPQPLMSKLTINANLSSSYKFIGMTFDLLQNHPELFKTTANNLLYIINVNTNYKPTVIYEMFKIMMNTDSILSRDEAIKILLPEVLIEDNTILDTSIEQSLNMDTNFSQTTCLIYLMVYYLKNYRQFNIYEPVFNNIKQAFDVYLNNPRITYNGETFDYRILKPLCYTKFGVNFFDDLIYWAYFLTFFINGRPYRFFDEIGSDSLSSRLYSSINDYFASYYKKLCKDLQIKITDDWSILYSIMQKEQQLESLQKMLDNMLNFDKLIALRNNEMNKSTELLDECFRDQNVLSQQFIYEAFCRNMDKLGELVIQHNPFEQFKFDMFKGKTIEEINNYHTLMQLVQLCITSSDVIKENYEIDDYTYNFNSFQNFRSLDQLGNAIIESHINEFAISKIKKPFTRADLMTQIATSYIWTKLIDRQTNGIFQSEGLGTEEISISHISVASSNTTLKLMNLFINGLYQKDYSNINMIFNYIKPVNEMLELHDTLRYLYPENCYKSELLPVMMLSYIKKGIEEMILNETVMSGQLISTSEITNGLKNTSTIDNLQKFNFHKYFFKIDVMSEQHQRLIVKLEDLLDGLLFVEHQGFARFVNASLQDLTSYMNECSIELPLVIGNDDDALRYALGGVQLYDKMIDINPFNRGYHYIKELFGNSEKLHFFHSITQYFDDISRIELIKNNTSLNTIKDILYSIGQLHTQKLMKLKMKRELVEYVIKQDGNRLYAEVKSFTNFISEEIEFIKGLLSYVFKNTIGTTIENMITCVSLSPINGTIFKITDNQFGGGGICVLEDTTGDAFELPLFKFRGSYESFYLRYTKPPGTKLLCNGLDILDNDGAKSLKVFIFTSVPLNTDFNMYDIKDI